MSLQVLYFARLRESLGISAEELQVPAEVNDIAGLMAWLSARGEVWQREFAGCRPLRAAINQELVVNTANFNDGDEIAFFPPVTGG